MAFLAATTALPESMFQMTGGTLTVGRLSGSSMKGYRGWFDDFKVFAQSFDPESCANHARGTLVGFASGANAQLQAQADLYSGSLGKAMIDDLLYHAGQTTYDHYAVHYDYTEDLGAHLKNLPTSVTGIRSNLLFPESPLFHDAHRPDSIANFFCHSCHFDSHPSPALQTGALTLLNMHLAKDDPSSSTHAKPSPSLWDYSPGLEGPWLARPGDDHE